MLEEQKNNPLHGVKLETLLTELVECYGFGILAEQININCFKSNPSIKSSLKFLRKEPWARNKLEAFYLYRFKQLPPPNDTDHSLEPGERPISLDQNPGSPVEIEAGEPEFVDESTSGVAYEDKKKAKTPRSRPRGRVEAAPYRPESGEQAANSASSTGDTVDPWAKWREKNEHDS
jgi:uncharacterized protein (DUF2132 family)